MRNVYAQFFTALLIYNLYIRYCIFSIIGVNSVYKRFETYSEKKLKSVHKMC